MVKDITHGFQYSAKSQSRLEELWIGTLEIAMALVAGRNKSVRPARVLFKHTVRRMDPGHDEDRNDGFDGLRMKLRPRRHRSCCRNTGTRYVLLVEVSTKYVDIRIVTVNLQNIHTSL